LCSRRRWAPPGTCPEAQQTPDRAAAEAAVRVRRRELAGPPGRRRGPACRSRPSLRRAGGRSARKGWDWRGALSMPQGRRGRRVPVLRTLLLVPQHTAAEVQVRRRKHPCVPQLPAHATAAPRASRERGAACGPALQQRRHRAPDERPLPGAARRRQQAGATVESGRGPSLGPTCRLWGRAEHTGAARWRRR